MTNMGWCFESVIDFIVWFFTWKKLAFYDDRHLKKLNYKKKTRYFVVTTEICLTIIAYFILFLSKNCILVFFKKKNFFFIFVQNSHIFGNIFSMNKFYYTPKRIKIEIQTILLGVNLRFYFFVPPPINWVGKKKIYSFYFCNLYFSSIFFNNIVIEYSLVSITP